MSIKVIAKFEEQAQRDIVKRLLAGETQQAIADDLNTSRGTIKRINAQMRSIVESEQVAEPKTIIELYELAGVLSKESVYQDLEGRTVVLTEVGVLDTNPNEASVGDFGVICSHCTDGYPDINLGLKNTQYMGIIEEGGNTEALLIAEGKEAEAEAIHKAFYKLQVEPEAEEPVEEPEVELTPTVTDIPEDDLSVIQDDVVERVATIFADTLIDTGGLKGAVEEEFNIAQIYLPDGDLEEIDYVNAVLDALGLETIKETVIEAPSSFTLVPNSIINVMHDGDIYTADSTHPRFDEIVRLSVEGDFDVAVKLIDVAKAIEHFSEGDISISGDTVLYKGQEVKSGLATRITEMMAEGDEGFKKYVAFMVRLRNNPSYRAVTELFGFIGHIDVDIDEEGYLIAWKGVTADWKDCRTKSVKNYVGNIIQMERNMVNENSNQTCSQGLHLCAWSYLSSFWGTGNVLKVRVDPADVVSIPTDYKDAKLRCARYEIIGAVNSDRELIVSKFVGNQIITVGERGKILKMEDRT